MCTLAKLQTPDPSLIKGLYCTLVCILRQPKIGIGNLQLSSYLVLVDPGIQV